ncbi:YdcF family protein [Phyllobacterium salinisoli]|uniref:YdcF family protein n=1 Tax=Phyllobacterium salinisoli TaxID=1899321 RepID=A0A368JWX4_9HYPH|nr:YdcF family protein [Phyllobacterium salinisoli]RCS21668.1 YdcF family protein [Phyllobacterium salinisoli]
MMRMVARNMRRMLLYSSLLIAFDPAQAEERGAISRIPAAATESLDIHDWLTALTELDYSADELRRWVPNGKLATVYAQLAEVQQSLRALRTLVHEKRLVTAASDNVETNLSDIQKFYTDYIRQPWLGDEKAYQSPDAIVMLGANQPTLDQRLAHALPILQRFKDNSIVLSGGGRTIVLEAQTMHDYLVRNGIAGDRLIMETDSLDTVGNAVFTGLALAKRGVGGGNVLLITSDFHAPRALFLFRSILGPQFRVAVSSAPYQGTDLSTRIDSELRQEATSIHDLLHWPAISNKPPRSVKDTCDVFFQLLLRHKLYASRWDLARRYGDQCVLPR